MNDGAFISDTVAMHGWPFNFRYVALNKLAAFINPEPFYLKRGVTVLKGLSINKALS